MSKSLCRDMGFQPMPEAPGLEQSHVPRIPKQLAWAGSPCHDKCALTLFPLALLASWRSWRFVLLLIAVVAATGCHHSHEIQTSLAPSVEQIDAETRKPIESPAPLYIARNDSFDVAIRLPASTTNSLQVQTPAGVSVHAYQLLDANRAVVNAKPLPPFWPAALLPLAQDGNTITLPQTDEDHLDLCIEISTAADATPGARSLTLSLDGNDRTIAFTIEPAGLSDSAMFVRTTIDISQIAAMYPKEFSAVSTDRLSRSDPTSADAVRVLDTLVQLFKDNGCELAITGLAPRAKWPPGETVSIDWTDYDALIKPWLSSSMAIHSWPVPLPRMVQQIEPGQRGEYLRAADAHFKEVGWANRFMPSTAPATQPTNGLPPLDSLAKTESAAALAFVRSVSFPTVDAVPNDDAPLFYPGDYFGTDQPLPSLRLKWLMQAKRDTAYYLARGTADRPFELINSLARPAGNNVDQLQSLFSGTDDAQQWRALRALLAQLPANPGNLAPAEQVAQQNMRLRWVTPLQQLAVLPRGFRWQFSEGPSPQLSVRLRVDALNPAPTTKPVSLQWQNQKNEPAATTLQSNQIEPLESTFVLAGEDKPVVPSAVVIDNDTRYATPVKINIPTAVSQRSNNAPTLDGSLHEWPAIDAIVYDQPLTQFASRDTITSKLLAPTDSHVFLFSRWNAERMSFAFQLPNLTVANLDTTTNVITYKDGRATGEDLCELIIRSFYDDGSEGSLLHLVCKPGGIWVEQKPGNEWQPVFGQPVFYSAKVERANATWRGELSIPWELINAPGKSRPKYLRFNFSVHNYARNQSSSWAGPIISGRDDSITGLLQLIEEQPLRIQSPSVGPSPRR